MSRLQLALTVDDLDAAVAFYGRLFDAEPHKRRAGYANFAIDAPPLKLVLFERPGDGGRLDHLGVEVGSTAEVADTVVRLGVAGLDLDVRADETCCHATQDKVWVTGADGERWEVYTITDDAPSVEPTATACCVA